MSEPQLLYRPEEAARLLQVSRSTVFELLASGALQSVLIGRSRRVPAAALDEFILRLRQTR